MKIVNGMQKWGASVKGQVVLVGLLVTGVIVGTSVPAFAQSYTVGNASSDVGSFIGGNFTTVGALILEVAGAILGLVVLMWGIKWVMGLFGGRRTKLS